MVNNDKVQKGKHREKTSNSGNLQQGSFTKEVTNHMESDK